MKEGTSAVMAALGAAVLLGLFYELRRQRASAREIREIHNIAARNLAETKQIHRTVRRTRGAVNDLHPYVMPMTKGRKKPLPKPHKINGRISPVRPCKKLKVETRIARLIGWT